MADVCEAYSCSFAFIRGSKIQVRMIQLEVKEADAAEIFQRGLQLRTDFINRSIRMVVEKVFICFNLANMRLIVNKYQIIKSK